MGKLDARKGASRAKDIPPHVLEALECGEMQTATLAECLALDQFRLLRAVFPELETEIFAEAKAAKELGIVKRMARMGEILLSKLGAKAFEHCQSHTSDTVRSWACFMVGAQEELDLE